MQHIVNHGVDIFDRLLHALSAETGLVAVAKLDCLKFTGRSAARSRTSADRTVGQRDFRFDRRISSGVDNLSSDNLLNCKMCQHIGSSTSENEC